MIIEEDWHGRPMIDQPTHLWIVAACFVAGAFFAGGAVVAFRRPYAPTRYAAATAVVAVVVLLIGGLYRRIWVRTSATTLGSRHRRGRRDVPRGIAARAATHALSDGSASHGHGVSRGYSESPQRSRTMD
jgi:hypothetical protein